MPIQSQPVAASAAAAAAVVVVVVVVVVAVARVVCDRAFSDTFIQ